MPVLVRMMTLAILILSLSGCIIAPPGDCFYNPRTAALDCHGPR